MKRKYSRREELRSFVGVGGRADTVKITLGKGKGGALL
jgi:hypothetical protein